ncbi:hypothetical protein [Noviherbaspirillum malthae]|uniref:hypothetical protein n=1 Tax=Noviherbaspirillum malthae TaxID=1260987 RepID=UPI00188E5018|nr:hypothetical protein [Noviherbaspirillum malthae]
MHVMPEIPDEIGSILRRWADAGEKLAEQSTVPADLKIRLAQAANTVRRLGFAGAGVVVLQKPHISFAKIEFMAQMLSDLPQPKMPTVEAEATLIRAWLAAHV